MALALRTYGADSQPAGPSQFCAIPLPVGVQDGDLIIVGILSSNYVNSLGGFTQYAGTISAPDASWTKVAQSDLAQQASISLFYKYALNEASQWVFTSDETVYLAGTVAVYAGADPFTPLDAYSLAVTAAGTSHGVPAVAASLAGETQVLFIGAAGSGTYTPATGYSQFASKQQTYASISFQQRAVSGTGTQAGTSETWSGGAAVSAAVTLTIAPSPARTTIQDVYNRLFDSLPRGVDYILDFTPGLGDFYKFFVAAASVVKIGFDIVDLLRQEVVPYTARYKLPDWERFFGLQATRTTQLGTIPQRQTQVLGAWRAAAAQSSSQSVVQSVFSTLFGYNTSTVPLVVEADRSAQTLLHSYEITGNVDTNIISGSSFTVYVGDGGTVSKMGAQLRLVFQNQPFTGTVTLLGPDGTSYVWAGSPNMTWTDAPIWLYAPSFAGAKIQGNWKVTITNAGAANVLLSGSHLFVEGIARGQSTAAAIFDWGVYADPLHLGENGTTPDLSAARRAAKRLGHLHGVGNLIQDLTPKPDTNTAIPDECIPT